jgi:hypothetical protein
MYLQQKIYYLKNILLAFLEDIKYLRKSKSTEYRLHLTDILSSPATYIVFWAELLFILRTFIKNNIFHHLSKFHYGHLAHLFWKGEAGLPSGGVKACTPQQFQTRDIVQLVTEVRLFCLQHQISFIPFSKLAFTF